MLLAVQDLEFQVRSWVRAVQATTGRLAVNDADSGLARHFA
jgi:hypothetical protein